MSDESSLDVAADVGEEAPTRGALDLLASPGGLVPEDATERDRALAIVKRGLIGLDAEPARIGRFVVLHRIGAGGMGVVYAAYDEELDRKVALKLLRDCERAQSERLRREAQVLARLSHPGVVQVYEVGTHEGELFIAMEYVRGMTLGRWCRAQTRAWPEVLAMHRQAGEGLAAAHAAGLVHRDFKPENVLVGDDGRVRVVDFGLAMRGGPAERGLGMHAARASETSDRLTRTGALMGTPAYMAPEQFIGGEVDGRTDQFSFCISLWEALYGERPFGDESSPATLGAAVLEGELRPPAAGAKVPSWIHDALVRGLSTDPAARHASMSALLTVLGHDPRRKRRVAAAIATLGVSGVAVLGAQAWASHRERLEVDRLTQACEAAGSAIDDVWNDGARAAVKDSLLASGLAYAPATASKVGEWLDARADEWRRARTDACMDADVNRTWSADVLDRSLWCLDERKSEMHALVAELSRGEGRGVQKAVQAAAGLASVTTCRDAEVLARRPTPPSEHRDEVDAIRTELSRVAALRMTGAYDEGLAVARAALERAQGSSWPPLVAVARLRTGMLLESRGEFAEAEAMLESAYFDAAEVGANETAVDAANQLVFTVGLRLARHVDGLRWSKLAKLLLATTPDPTGVRTADHLEKTALVQARAGNFDEAQASLEHALAMQERALGPDHPDLAFRLNNLATTRLEAGQGPQAEPYYERALGIAEHAFGPDHPVVGTLLHNLGNVKLQLGSFEAARSFYERALAIRERALGAGHPDVGGTLNNLGELYYRTHDYPRACEHYERALAIAQQALGPEHPEVSGSLGNIGNVHQATGEFELARQAHERSLAIAEKALGPRHPRVAACANNLANAYASLGQPDRARPLLERALSIREEVFGAEHPEVTQTLHNLATLERSSGDKKR